MAERPTGREKHVTSGGTGVYRRGHKPSASAGAGPSPSGQPSSGGGPSVNRPQGNGSRSGGGGPLKFIILLIVVLLGGGGGIGALLGGGGSSGGGSSSGGGTSSGGISSGTGSSQQAGSSAGAQQGFGDSYDPYEDYAVPGFGSHAGYGYGGGSSSGTGSQSGSGSSSGYGDLLEMLLGGSGSGSSWGSGSVGSGSSSWGSGSGSSGSGSWGSGSGSSGSSSWGSSSWGGDGGYSTDTVSGQDSGMDLSSLADLFTGGVPQSAAGLTAGWNDGKDNRGVLNTAVSNKARRKFTQIKGNGRDTVTVMVYMCGTDLESKSGMATSDLSEMAGADLADNVQVIVYTGGCKKWQNSVVSAGCNQIYRVRKGGLERLVDNDGDRAMTDPATLTRFIKWCAANYPANRNQLIFWDHGSGSLSGYGYDQKHASAGSMGLTDIRKAIVGSGVKFDFIGFDTCLLATVENALSLAEAADYMIASEETEPGTGWYYTEWLSYLSQDTSIDTRVLGKKIIDDFVEVSAQKARGQATTLSLTDLAELEATFPAAFSKFSKTTSSLIQNAEYKTVSKARKSSREFAASNRIDQVDLTDLAWKIGNKESMELAQVLLDAIKYNRTSTSMCNSYGLSIYFPGSRLSKVDSMVSTYKQLGLDADYSKCIQQYATVSAAGQSASGGSSSVFDMLSGSGYGSSGGGSYGGSYGVGSDMLMELVGSLLSGRSMNIDELDRSNTAFLQESGLDAETVTRTLEKDCFDTSALAWSTATGYHTLHLTEEQWDQVSELTVNMLFDDGEGYIDLGNDNVFTFNDAGDLLGETDRTWISINSQPVAYYHIGTVKDGDGYISMGRVPCLLNNEYVDLIIAFDPQNPYGYIAGARTDYRDGETETLAKAMTELKDGDTLDFICNYYTYDGKFDNRYFLGETMTVDGTPLISNTDVGEGGALVSYRFTDLYGQQYWTEAVAQ